MAWPDPADPDYRNGVALVHTVLPPLEVLATLHEVEAEFGRIRGMANAPRTLDLDLIAYGRTTISATDLCLPHPRAHERLFVMGPLAELAPEWLHPVLGRSAADLAEQATVGRDAFALASPGSPLWTSASEAGISAPSRKKGDIPGGVA
jgi:2-amino-4-hydroxy-6-hydroxymethyldihydropteridine diphosphokinase